MNVTTHNYSIDYVIQLVASAKKSLAISIPEITSALILEAILKKRNQGIEIRLLIPRVGSQASIQALTKCGFKKILDWRPTTGKGLSNRQKVVIVDEKEVYFGVLPWRDSSFLVPSPVEFSVKARAFVVGFLRYFNAQWSEPRGPLVVDLDGRMEYFKPIEKVKLGPAQQGALICTPYPGNLILESLCDLMSVADDSVYFSFSCIRENRILEILEELIERGIKIEGALEDRAFHEKKLKNFPRVLDLVRKEKIVINDFVPAQKYWIIDEHVIFQSSSDFNPVHSPLHEFDFAAVFYSSIIARKVSASLRSGRQAFRRIQQAI